MIGKYFLGETLGTGGYSKVKLGIDSITGERVALKIMMANAQGEVSKSQKQQLVRELSVMSAVKHPNVIRLIDFNAEAEYPALDGKPHPCLVTVLELASGGELFDFLMYTGNFDEVTTRTYFHQLISGIEACHKSGIAHRDIKPENLLLDENYNLKIADFGFAKHFISRDGSRKAMTTACGTRGYLSPELLRGEKYTHLCDIFACGIILFTLFAGFPPFQHAVGTDWWWNKLELKNYQLFWMAHERTRKFNDSLKDLIVKMLAADPKERYDIDDIKKHPWYKGAVWSDRDLKKHLQRRRKTVSKERTKKMREKQENIEVRKTKQVYRGVEDQLPVGTPEMSEYSRQAAQLGSIELFEDALEDFDGREFVETYKQFKTSCHPREMAGRIKRIAVYMSGECRVCPEHNLIMVRVGVGDKAGGNENVLFAVKQYSTDIPNKYIVVFKRYQGDPLKYHNVVDIFLSSDEILSVMDLSEV